PLDAGDAQSTRTALGFLGYGGEKAGGGDGGDLFSGLRAFQQDNGLDVDGVMNPEGPTARKLGEVLAENRPQAPAVPQGDTVDLRLRSLMDDPRYADPADPAGDALRIHVTDQFQKAYPGEVEYDGVGRMIRPRPSIAPQEVDPFDPDEALPWWERYEGRIGWAKLSASSDQFPGGEDMPAPLPQDFLQGVRDTFHAGEEGRRAAEAVQEAHRQGIAEREKTFLPGLGGGDQAAFEGTVKEIDALRENDPKGYDMLSAETRAIYEKYGESREQYDRIAERRPGGATEEHRAQARKDAFDTTMHVGALRHIGGAVGEAWDTAKRQIGQSDRVLRGEGAAPAPADGAGSDVPPGYRNSPIYGQVRGAVDTGAGLIPGLGALKGAGETAEGLAGAGASPEAQRAAALGVAAVDALGGKLVRKGGRIAVEGLDAAGMSLLKRLPPEIHVALGLAADEVIDGAARKGVERIYRGYKGEED
ncbi:MAG: peptidoglycan-binding protein, partial [Rhodospirillaceae bacterium]